MLSASAPGKVLICGGYLVVEAPNVGLSIGVSARFTTEVTERTKDDDSSSSTVVIRVQSPQFRTEFLFTATVEANQTVSVVQQQGPKSPFLYYGILYALGCAVMLQRPVAGESITLRLLASNDFYSQRNYLESRGEHVSVATLRTVPEHNPLVGDVSKTGLGSSAAMTTSFVAALLAAFGVADDVERVHRIAQVAHSVAQGKIGSGFDVFTATYGTSIYRRFPAACAEMMMKGSAAPTQVDVATLATCIDPTSTWVEHTPFQGLPKGLFLVLGDIHQGGSATPGMVAKVMAWRASVKGVEGNLWDQLGATNLTYVSRLQTLCRNAEQYPEDNDKAVKRLSATVIAEASPSTPVEQEWLHAASDARTVRRLLRDIGQAAEVSIEPDVLTPLLDATSALPGVFVAGCPGAGGYDAVFALVVGEANCRQLEEFWESYKGVEVCPLLVREDPQGLSFSK